MIRTSTAMAKEPLCPLIMKGFPILFLELSVLFPCLKGTRILAGSVSFEGAFLGHLFFRAMFLILWSHVICILGVRKHGNL